MSNMDYCRFQNTLTDFRDCVNTVEAMQYDGFDLSHEEKKSFAQMLEQAVTLIQMVGDAVGRLDSDMIQSCLQDPDEVADKFAATCLNVDSEGDEECTEQL